MKKFRERPPVSRVLVVDDSAAVRGVLARTLRQSGYDVDEASSAETAVEQVADAPPDLVVTDLVMSGLSGVQLCRLLKSDLNTAHVPIVLLTASGDKRSRFWARSAGAVAYVNKDRLEDLVALLPSVLENGTEPPSSRALPRYRDKRSAYERMSAILDTALFDSVVAGEVRALASTGSIEQVFEGLVAVLNDVMTYRWMAVLPARPHSPVFFHCHPSERDAMVPKLPKALDVAPDREIVTVLDERAVPGEGDRPESAAVVFANEQVGRVVIGPTSRGLSNEDRRLLALVATELGGPMQMASLYEEARTLATTDMLTGLLNRRAFLDYMERERTRAERHSLPISLLLLDIDHFKHVNDKYGHNAGDVVLRGAAQTLALVARKSDVVARWGGEEFVVALPQTGAPGARVAAERVRHAIEGSSHSLPTGEVICVTASVGVASFAAPWNVESLVSVADAAMYVAKGRGRNRVEVGPAAEQPRFRPGRPKSEGQGTSG
jgi:two-component system cell cycle response regulator